MSTAQRVPIKRGTARRLGLERPADIPAADWADQELGVGGTLLANGLVKLLSVVNREMQR